MLSPHAPRPRIFFPVVVLLATAGFAALVLRHVSGALAAESHAATPGPTPVIVELFTSEGCSSCPPADALLARLQREQPISAANVIALEEHVDYWDNLGWHDRFSSAIITARQGAYARRFRLDDSYTPQMVVDGDAQFVGNDSAKALDAVTRAAKSPKPGVAVQALMVNGNHIAGQLRLPASAPAGAELYAALVQPQASTQVLRGENGGHTLNHVAVVRSLQRVPVRGTSGDFSMTIPQGSPAVGLYVVTFLQRAGQGTILAAASVPLPPTPTMVPAPKP